MIKLFLFWILRNRLQGHDRVNRVNEKIGQIVHIHGNKVNSKKLQNNFYNTAFRSEKKICYKNKREKDLIKNKNKSLYYKTKE